MKIFDLIFLTENFNENPIIKYFAIDKSKIETLRVCETYDHEGQKVGHSIWDYIVINKEIIIDIGGSKEKFMVGETINAYDSCAQYCALYNSTNGRDTEGFKFVTKYVDGFNYWNGQSWRTITTYKDDGEPTHIIIKKYKDLFGKLFRAILNKECVKETLGNKLYKSENWTIEERGVSESWEAYLIYASKIIL